MTDVPKKILIIEDDELIAKMYQASLAQAKFQVQFAVDGEQGWEMVQSYLPDLVILDYMMPKLNGIEVLQKIRADVRFAHLPVIVASSLMGAEDRERALAAGATDYWIKSEINMVGFEQKINTILASNSQSQLQ